MAGLLAGLEPKHYPALFFAAARADKPFGDQLAPRWQAGFADAKLAAWIRDKGSKLKEDDMQVAAARALQFAGSDQKEIALAALRSFLQKRSEAVVQAAAGALTRIDAKPEAAALLQQLIKAQKKATSPTAIAAMNELQAEDSAWQKQLLQLGHHKHGAIRAAALRALQATAARKELKDPDAAFNAADAALAHKEWQVRAAGLDLLVALRKPASPPLLFPLLKKERARMLADVRSALRDLTGLQFASVAEWQAWWQKEGDTFQPRAAAAKPERKKAAHATVSYWNIPVHSDRVAFVVDMSGSMLKPFGTGNATRLYEAKRQLRNVLAALPAKAKTDIITFEGKPTPLFGKLQALGKKQKKQAEAFLKGLVAKGPTNVHDALARAFENRDVDTIYVLTDGRPSTGPIVDHERLAAEVARWNAARGIRIHTIAIGQKSDLLERLARDSGGEHVVTR